jgi:hypothetical protein
MAENYVEDIIKRAEERIDSLSKEDLELFLGRMIKESKVVNREDAKKRLRSSNMREVRSVLKALQTIENLEW